METSDNNTFYQYLSNLEHDTNLTIYLTNKFYIKTTRHNIVIKNDHFNFKENSKDLHLHIYEEGLYCSKFNFMEAGSVPFSAIALIVTSG